MTPRTAILIAVTAVLAIANLNLWAIHLIDRTLERAEQRRVITLQDTKTKQMYACYVSKEKKR